jgi:hypothetical protein
MVGIEGKVTAEIGIILVHPTYRLLNNLVPIKLVMDFFQEIKSKKK